MDGPQEEKTKTRPARAGFIQLAPSPPKLHLTTAIANTDAAAGMNKGTWGGMLKPTRTPVTTALKSPRVLSPLKMRVQKVFREYSGPGGRRQHEDRTQAKQEEAPYSGRQEGDENPGHNGSSRSPGHEFAVNSKSKPSMSSPGSSPGRQAPMPSTRRSKSGDEGNVGGGSSKRRRRKTHNRQDPLLPLHPIARDRCFCKSSLADNPMGQASIHFPQDRQAVWEK